MKYGKVEIKYSKLHMFKKYIKYTFHNYGADQAARGSAGRLFTQTYYTLHCYTQLTLVTQIFITLAGTGSKK